MEDYVIFDRYPDLKELIRAFRHEMQQAQRPSNEVILDDVDVMKLLKISKRTLCTLRARHEIPFYQPRPHSSSYYILADILEWLNESKIESFRSKRRI